MIKILPIFVPLLFLVCCADDPVQPPEPIDPFLSCGQDTVWHWARWETAVYQLTVSSFNGYWAGIVVHTVLGHRDVDGLFVYDPDNDRSVVYLDSAYAPTWSPDGKALLFLRKGNVFTVNLFNMKITQLTSDNINWQAHWHPSGDSIYIYKYQQLPLVNGTYIVDINASKPHVVAQDIVSFGSFDKHRIVTVGIDELYIYDTWADNFRSINIPLLVHTSWTEGEATIKLSPLGTYIMFETTTAGVPTDSKENGLWVCDTTNWVARRVLRGAWYGSWYHPTWASENTVYASVYCPRDSVVNIWEFDLNGNAITQVTQKDMKLW